MTCRPGVCHFGPGGSERDSLWVQWFDLIKSFGSCVAKPDVQKLKGVISLFYGPRKRQALRAPRPCTWRFLFFGFVKNN